MEAGAGKVACRGARVNIGDIDEMVSTNFFLRFFVVVILIRSFCPCLKLSDSRSLKCTSSCNDWLPLLIISFEVL